MSDVLAGANIRTLEALVGSMELSQSSVAALTGVGFDLAKSPDAFLLTSREVFVNFTDMACERMQALYGVDVATSGAMVDYLGPLFRGESETTRVFLSPDCDGHAIEMTELIKQSTLPMSNPRLSLGAAVPLLKFKALQPNRSVRASP